MYRSCTNSQGEWPVHTGDKVDCCRNRQQIGNKVDCCRYGRRCCQCVWGQNDTVDFACSVYLALRTFQSHHILQRQISWTWYKIELYWILKFADDSKIFSRIQDADDHLRLQKDLNQLLEWSRKWQMKFDVEKCKVMHVGSSNPRYTYEMDGTEIQVVYLKCIVFISTSRQIVCLVFYGEHLKHAVNLFCWRCTKVLSTLILRIVHQSGRHIIRRTRSCWRKSNTDLPDYLKN